MNNKVEYIGRPLNVAARLQAAVRRNDEHPEGKLLISKNAFTKLRLSQLKKYQGNLMEMKLHNLSAGGKYQARKVDLCR